MKNEANEQYQHINDELIELRKTLAHTILKNISLKKSKFELVYNEKPKYVVLPNNCLSILNIYTDEVVFYADSIGLLGMTIIESPYCANFTDIFVL